MTSDTMPIHITVVPDSIAERDARIHTLQQLREHECRVFDELVEERDRLRIALGYFLNGEAYASTFPDNDMDADNLRKCATENRLIASRILTSKDQAESSEAMKRHAADQPRFKAQMAAILKRLSEHKA